VNRALNIKEERLFRWMLGNGTPEAKDFLPQLALAEVTPWRCACGCASINFHIKGYPDTPPGVHVIAEFLFDNDIDNEVCGIFIFEKSGILSGLEVYGMVGEAPKSLPSPEALRAAHFRRIQSGPKPPNAKT